MGSLVANIDANTGKPRKPEGRLVAGRLAAYFRVRVQGGHAVKSSTSARVGCLGPDNSNQWLLEEQMPFTSAMFSSV